MKMRKPPKAILLKLTEKFIKDAKLKKKADGSIDGIRVTWRSINALAKVLYKDGYIVKNKGRYGFRDYWYGRPYPYLKHR